MKNAKMVARAIRIGFDFKSWGRVGFGLGMCLGYEYARSSPMGKNGEL